MSKANRQRRVSNRHRAADQRAAAQQHAKEQRESKEWLAEQVLRPEVIAYRDRQESDAEAVARVAADKPAQRARLLAVGFLQRWDGFDGAGCWDCRGLRILHSLAREQDGQLWGHVSVSRRDRLFPTWEQVRDANWLLYPERYGVVVIAPEIEHINLREVAHVWTCLTADTVPDFTQGLGTI